MKQQMPEIKRHFKMYKSGKLWLVAGITAASLMVGGQAASAADNVQLATTASTVQDQPKTEGQANSGATTPTPDKSGTQTSGANSGATSGSTTTDQGNKTDGNKDANQPAKDDGTTKETVDGDNVLVTTKDGQVSLQDKDGKPVSGVKTINGKTYSFGKDGIAQTGLQTVDNKNYYFNKDGVAQTGWQTVNGKKYYFGKDGVALTGWQTLPDDKKYYFDTKTGEVYTGLREVDGKLTYFDKNGVNAQYQFVQDGNLLITYANGQTAYAKSDASPLSGWLTQNGKKYYFGKDGLSLTGKQTVENNTYFFNKDGVLFTNGVKKVAGAVYYFGKDGVSEGGFKDVKEGDTTVTYYFGLKGDHAAVKGLQNIDGKTYYFDPTTFQMWKNKTLTIGDAKYTFGADGIATKKDQIPEQGGDKKAGD